MVNAIDYKLWALILEYLVDN